MSNTPRTDEQCHVGEDGCTNIIMIRASFARQLERELAAMTAAKNEALDMLRNIHEVFTNQSRSGITVSDLRDLIAKLEDAK